MILCVTVVIEKNIFATIKKYLMPLFNETYISYIFFTL